MSFIYYFGIARKPRASGMSECKIFWKKKELKLKKNWW